MSLNDTIDEGDTVATDQLFIQIDRIMNIFDMAFWPFPPFLRAIARDQCPSRTSPPPPRYEARRTAVGDALSAFASSSLPSTLSEPDHRREPMRGRGRGSACHFPVLRRPPPRHLDQSPQAAALSPARRPSQVSGSSRPSPETGRRAGNPVLVHLRHLADRCLRLSRSPAPPGGPSESADRCWRELRAPRPAGAGGRSAALTVHRAKSCGFRPLLSPST